MSQTATPTMCPYCGLRLSGCESIRCPQPGARTVLPPPVPPGCICPPGANLTCEAPLCPRKPAPSMTRIA